MHLQLTSFDQAGVHSSTNSTHHSEAPFVVSEPQAWALEAQTGGLSREDADIPMHMTSQGGGEKAIPWWVLYHGWLSSSSRNCGESFIDKVTKLNLEG